MKELGIKEAIEYLRRHFDNRFFDGMFDARSAQKKAIDALKKEIPQKPIGNRCPKCGGDSISVWMDGGFRETQFDFCPVCGQALDWGDVRC